MCVFIVFATFLKYLANSRDLVYCGPSLTITALVVTSGCFYVRHEPVEQNCREDFIRYTQQAYSSMLEHIVTSPFLCIGQIMLQLQTSGMFSVVQILIISWCMCSTKSGLAFFINSACMRSIPGALLSLSFRIVLFTSSSVGIGSSLAGSTWQVSWLIMFWWGSSVFSSSSKCSAHLLRLGAFLLYFDIVLFRAENPFYFYLTFGRRIYFHCCS